MGLFDIVEDDFETEVEEFNPFLKPGTYEVIVSNVTTEDKTDTNGVSRKYLVITYTVTDGDSKGKTHREQQWIVPGKAVTEDEKRARSFIKTRMLQFGIAENQINTTEPEDVIGIEGALTLIPQKNRPEYNNVARFALFQSGPTPTLPEELDEPAPATQRSSKAKDTKKDDPFS